MECRVPTPYILSIRRLYACIFFLEVNESTYSIVLVKTLSFRDVHFRTFCPFEGEYIILLTPLLPVRPVSSSKIQVKTTFDSCRSLHSISISTPGYPSPWDFSILRPLPVLVSSQISYLVFPRYDRCPSDSSGLVTGFFLSSLPPLLLLTVSSLDYRQHFFNCPEIHCLILPLYKYLLRRKPNSLLYFPIWYLTLFNFSFF